MTTKNPLHWDLSNVYPGLESPELAGAIQNLREQTAAIEQALLAAPGPDAPTVDLSLAVHSLLERFNWLFSLSRTVSSYLNSFVSTDSFNAVAARKQSEFDQIGVAIQQQSIRFESWLGKITGRVEEIIGQDELANAHAFFLRESAEQSRYLMSPDQEDLAAELSLSGGLAWRKLQGVVTSQLSVPFELDGKMQNLPLPALINLHSHPDESVRKRAYEAEIAAEASIREPLAAALNGVKGAVNTLERRRGRIDAIHSAVDTARIDRETLDAMLGAMQSSFPMFWRYFQAKAKRMGKERLAWWDVFAPSGRSNSAFSFEQAQAFILEHFGGFSPELASFAQHAFENHWIDAEQRTGKRGGAFCMGLPEIKESRVLCNFDGSLDQVSTIAHELGHAFHNECAYRAGKTILQCTTPMTLAETASILCETIITEAALGAVKSPEEELAILETSLVGDAQVIVDIYSRFLFEKEVFERRQKSELSADEFCEIMASAQRATYGEGLDERYLHPYMWTWKPHYYMPGLNFYNFPYAFGLLFGTGLYAIYQQRGADFVQDYVALLASTGEASAAELAQRFGIDIRSRAFWKKSLSVIGKRIERYIAL